MIERMISKEELQKRLNELLADYEIIGPRKLDNGRILFETIREAKDIYLGERFTVEPMKKYFLEPSTWLLRQCSNKECSSIETLPQSNKKRIIIGTRACEARALELLDNIFDSDFKDEFYINNRRRTTIIGLACAQPDKSCFCTSMEASPVETRGMDIMLFGLKDKFAAEVITDKGKSILGDLGNEIDADKKKLLQDEKKRIVGSLTKKVDVPESLESTYESPYWEEVSKSCVSCGVCTYLCPSCHCFDLSVEERKVLRCYDGCSFPEFTQETSGGNPRPTNKERYRQRVFHKFDYFKRNFKENLCVGCGRCIRYCPVKIDIAQIAQNAPVSKKEK